MRWLYTLSVLSVFISAIAKEDTKLNIIKGAGSYHLKAFIEKNITRYNKIYCCPCFKYKADKCHGSRDGREALYASKVSFAGSDIPAPLHEQEMQPDVLLNIPVVFSALALVYNLPKDDPECCFPRDFVLSLTAQDIINIFIKKEKVSWASLLNKPYNNIRYRGRAYIRPIAPAASTGLRELLASLICKAFQIFPSHMQEGESQLSITSSTDVSERIKEIPGSLGYTTFPQARYHEVKIAQIQSSCESTLFIEPSLESIQKAAHEACSHRRCPEVPDAYPLAFTEYLIVFAHQPSEFFACNLAQFIYFVITEGQKFARSLCLVPLPCECVLENLRLLDKICSIICRPCLPPCNPCEPKVIVECACQKKCEPVCKKKCEPPMCQKKSKLPVRKKKSEPPVRKSKKAAKKT